MGRDGGPQVAPPRGFGYGRQANSDARRSCRQYCTRHNKFTWCGMHMEEFQDQLFLERPVARGLTYQLAPGELLVSCHIHRIFNSLRDCVSTFELFKLRDIRLHIVGCKDLSVDLPLDEIEEIAKQYLALASPKLWKEEVDTRATPYGWQRVNGKLLTCHEERVAALQIVNLHDRGGLSFPQIYKKHLEEPLWPRKGKLNKHAFELIYRSAKNRFPGPNGEVEESVEGMGV